MVIIKILELCYQRRIVVSIVSFEQVSLMFYLYCYSLHQFISCREPSGAILQKDMKTTLMYDLIVSLIYYILLYIIFIIKGPSPNFISNIKQI